MRMWEKRVSNIALIEALEDRQLMSAAPHAMAMPAPLHRPAIVMSYGPALKTISKAAPVVTSTVALKSATTASQLPAFIPNKGGFAVSNIVGAWTGTMRLDGTKVDAPFSIKFLFQRGVAATGTFNLGPTIGNQSLSSTLIFSLQRNFRVLILTPDLWAGFVGALTANAKILMGRFSFNSTTGWHTGVFTLNRV